MLVRSSVVPSSPSRSPRLRASLTAWPDAVSSSIAEGESLGPSYTPTTMQPVRCFSRLPALTLNSMPGRAASSLRDAAREHAKDFAVERFAQHPVFDPRVDVRVAVDLDEIEAGVDPLPAHSLQAPAGPVGGGPSAVDPLLARPPRRHPHPIPPAPAGPLPRPGYPPSSRLP